MHAFKLLLSVSVLGVLVACGGDQLGSPAAPSGVSGQSAVVAGQNQVEASTAGDTIDGDYYAASLQKEGSWDERTPDPKGMMVCKVLVKVKNSVFKDKTAKIRIRISVDEGEALIEDIPGAKKADIGQRRLEKCDEFRNSPQSTGKFLLRKFGGKKKKLLRCRS